MRMVESKERVKVATTENVPVRLRATYVIQNQMPKSFVCALPNAHHV